MAEELEIRATLDGAEVEQAAEEMGDQVSSSMDKAAESTKRLGDETGKAADKARQLSGALKAAAIAIGGMAVSMAGNYLRSEGKDKAADYVDSVGSNAMRGAVIGAAAGSVIPGVGTVAGGLIGGVAGGISGFFNQGLKDRAQERTNIANAGESLGRFDELRGAQKEMERFYASLSSGTMQYADKQKAL